MALPRLGLGTWHMGESRDLRAAEVAALRAGLDLGVTLLDTAEMYGDGGAEEVVREAIRGRRDAVFVVSKFYPHHASRAKLPRACEASLARLGIDRIDLYLYHWRGGTPLAETVEALEKLREAGRIARWGVSNFDVGDMEELEVAARGSSGPLANQVLYNLSRRGIEFDLLPRCREGGVDVMAYSPLDEGPLARHPAVGRVAKRLGLTAAQVAIAWTIRGEGVCTIPKSSSVSHVREIVAARDVRLDAQSLGELDAAFPPPTRRRPLEVI